MKFSKTSILAGLQCSKHLHLALHHPEWASPFKSPAAVTGQVVGDYARSEYPGGILLERASGDGDAFISTAELMGDESVPALFEAGFRVDDLAIFVDILKRAGDQWDLIEVKAGTSVEDHHIDDVTIQALVLKRCSVPVYRYRLMHINKEFIYQGEGDYQDIFVCEDITERVQAHLHAIEHAISGLKNVAEGPQPVRHIGSHCNKPYPCEYMAYCEKQDAGYPVAWLPRGHVVARKLVDAGIYDIRDIPADELNSETHQWIRRVTINGVPDLLPGAAGILNALDYPRYYLDFESIQFAIPIWKGTTPYQQLPFQWSCHIQSSSGKLEHHEFLDTSGNDPRRAFVEAMINVCGETGPIIVYNQSFEKRIIRELAEAFPDLEARLLALNDRVFDLLPVVNRHYYHPAMKGSWSIKKVLPCLAPELRYSDLGEVQDGTQAQAVFLDIINGLLDADVEASLIHDLKAYCKLDTYAMVVIARKLCGG